MMHSIYNIIWSQNTWVSNIYSNTKLYSSFLHNKIKHSTLITNHYRKKLFRNLLRGQKISGTVSTLNITKSNQFWARDIHRRIQQHRKKIYHKQTVWVSPNCTISFNIRKFNEKCFQLYTTSGIQGVDISCL